MGAHLVPEDAARSRFCGYVRVRGDEFKVRVRGIRYDPRSGRAVFDAAQLDVERALATRLAAHGATLKLRLAQAASLEGFVAELEELVAVCCRPQTTRPRGGRQVATSLPSATYYTHLMAELDAVGWNHLLQLSDDLRTVELQTHDAAGRTHAVRVLLPLEYPSVSAAATPMCLVDAPEPFELHLPASGTSSLLAEVLCQLEQFLARFQAFWNALDALDASTCVLEPQHPTRATGRRRVALERHASVQLEVSPSQPTALLDELSFFGSQASVGVLRERWGSYAATRWDATQPLRENLERILELTLPSPSITTPEEFAVECGICYSYRLEPEDKDNCEADADSDTDGQAPSKRHKTASSSNSRSRKSKSKSVNDSKIPDRLCENSKCNRPFHAQCLFEWLRALPTSRQSFHTVFGECPYCREAISAKWQSET